MRNCGRGSAASEHCSAFGIVHMVAAGWLLLMRQRKRYNAKQAAPGAGGKKAAPFLSEMCWRVAVSAYAGAAICLFGPILRSGFRV